MKLFYTLVLAFVLGSACAMADTTENTPSVLAAVKHIKALQFQDAINDCDQGIKTDPKNGWLFYCRGTANVGLKNDQQAIQDLSEAISLGFDQSGACMIRQFCYMRTNQPDKQLADCDTTIKLGDKMAPTAFSDLGKQYLALSKWELALKNFTAAKQLFSRNQNWASDPKWDTWQTDLLDEIAFCYDKMGQYDKAIPNYLEALKFKSTVPATKAWIYENLGDDYRAMKRYQDALNSYAEASKTDPSGGSYGIGLVSFDQGHYQDAIPLISKAIDDKPSSARYYKRGYCYTQLNQSDKAASDFTAAIKLDPKDMAAYWERARCYLNLKQYQNAVDDATQSINLGNKGTDIYLVRGQSRFYLHQLDLALPDLNSAVAADPKNVSALSFRASIYRVQKKFDLSKRDLDQSIALAPKAAGPYLDRAKLYCDQDNFPAALADCNQAINLAPAWVDALTQRALVNERLENWQAVCTDDDLAIRLEPSNAFSYSQRAFGEMNLKQLSQALVDANKAIGLSPNLADGYAARASVMRNQGRARESLNDYDKAINLSPNEPATLFNRALAYEDLGDYQRAAADTGKALQLDPNFPHALEHHTAELSHLR